VFASQDLDELINGETGVGGHFVSKRHRLGDTEIEVNSVNVDDADEDDELKQSLVERFKVDKKKQMRMTGGAGQSSMVNSMLKSESTQPSDGVGKNLSRFKNSCRVKIGPQFKTVTVRPFFDPNKSPSFAEELLSGSPSKGAIKVNNGALPSNYSPRSDINDMFEKPSFAKAIELRKLSLKLPEREVQAIRVKHLYAR